MLFQLKLAVNQCNTKVVTKRTKSMVIVKVAIRYRLLVEDEIIEQGRQLKCLEVDVTCGVEIKHISNDNRYGY